MDSSFRSKDVALAPTPSLCTNQLNSRRGRRSHNNNLIILRKRSAVAESTAQMQNHGPSSEACVCNCGRRWARLE